MEWAVDIDWEKSSNGNAVANLQDFIKNNPQNVRCEIGSSEVQVFLKK
jgi:hypothetical protein